MKKAEEKGFKRLKRKIERKNKEEKYLLYFLQLM
jgi:hypothetical protein